jgi:hypothetical protein
VTNSKENMSFFKNYCGSHPSAISFKTFSDSVSADLENVIKELDRIKKQSEQVVNDSTQIALYKTLSVFGGIYAFFAGFDGMLSVLSILFPSLNTSLMISLGLVASFSALGVFLSRDRQSIAEALEIQEEEKLDTINDYLFSLEKYYRSLYIKSLKETDNFEIMEHLDSMLALRELLVNKSKLNEDLANQSMNYIQAQSVIGIGAILFFSDGFFIGQGLALLISQFLLVNSAPLVLGLSIFLGLMALSAYWFVERPYVETYLYQELLTDEKKVQESISHLDQELEVLKKFKALELRLSPTFAH